MWNLIVSYTMKKQIVVNGDFIYASVLQYVINNNQSKCLPYNCWFDQWSKSIQTKAAQNHTLYRDTFQYGFYKGLAPRQEYEYLKLVTVTNLYYQLSWWNQIILVYSSTDAASQFL